MRSFLLICTMAVFSIPLVAKADASVALSVGSGWQVDPGEGRVPTNLLIAPGLSIIGEKLLRLEVGFAADLPDVKDSEFDLQVRPMLVFQPLGPLYLRVVSGVTQVVQGPIGLAFGGAVGLNADISEHGGIFAEAGYIPRAVDEDFISVFEGRMGLSFDF